MGGPATTPIPTSRESPPVHRLTETPAEPPGHDHEDFPFGMKVSVAEEAALIKARPEAATAIVFVMIISKGDRIVSDHCLGFQGRVFR